jgi:NADH:ubiquinone oxidoreductase subunit K
MSKGTFTFAFTRKNYILLIIGIAIVMLGYVLMSGGGSEDPTQFDPSIFSARRITLAPMVVLAGYVFVVYAIMYREKKNANTDSSIPTAKK